MSLGSNCGDVFAAARIRGVRCDVRSLYHSLRYRYAWSSAKAHKGQGHCKSGCGDQQNFAVSHNMETESLSHSSGHTNAVYRAQRVCDKNHRKMWRVCCVKSRAAIVFPEHEGVCLPGCCNRCRELDAPEIVRLARAIPVRSQAQLKQLSSWKCGLRLGLCGLSAPRSPQNRCACLPSGLVGRRESPRREPGVLEPSGVCGPG